MDKNNMNKHLHSSKCYSGLTLEMRASMTTREQDYLFRNLAGYAKSLGVSLNTSVDESDTIWWEDTHPKLEAFLTGYIVALGFDEYGNRSFVPIG
jgi:hypothetical protein